MKEIIAIINGIQEGYRKFNNSNNKVMETKKTISQQEAEREIIILSAEFNGKMVCQNEAADKLRSERRDIQQKAFDRIREIDEQLRLIAATNRAMKRDFLDTKAEVFKRVDYSIKNEVKNENESEQ